MTEAESLYMSILTEPGDDVRRRIYADWIDDHPDDFGPAERARAELIRVQCDLADVRRRHDHECTGTFTRVMERAVERRSLEERAHALVADYGFTWCDGLSGPEMKTDGYYKVGTAVGVRYTYTRLTDWVSQVRDKMDVGINAVIFDFDRGFPGSVILNWQHWVRRHQYLYWHPEKKCQTLTPEGWIADTLEGWIGPGIPKQARPVPVQQVTLVRTNRLRLDPTHVPPDTSGLSFSRLRALEEDRIVADTIGLEWADTIYDYRGKTDEEPRYYIDLQWRWPTVRFRIATPAELVRGRTALSGLIDPSNETAGADG